MFLFLCIGGKPCAKLPKDVPSGKTSVKISGLKSGEVYTVTVSAVNSAGEGPASEPAAGLFEVDTAYN